ncbi:MAG: N-acetylmuramoyl-L-alanine amidase [Corynebacterium sp.]|nr:N-acetylmuramoyl-L-alanine amidase [Corynebacterium sp.]
MTDSIRPGESSPRVAEVRTTLAGLGLLTSFEGDVSKWKTRSFSEDDKFFDEDLAEVLKAFQQSRGIVPTGKIDETTLRELRHASYRLGARVLQYQPSQELIGDDVSELQNQLQELGFYVHRIDGHFGPCTHEALRTYQLNSGLQQDGICGPKTLRALSLLGRRITGGSPLRIREREHVRVAGPQLAGKRVVIDPGLGGATTGRTVSGRYGEVTEEELLWDLAKRTEGRMISTGMETIISRQRGDDPSARDRAEIANAFDADLMISLRFDSYPNEKASGVASFYFGSEIGSSSMTGEMFSGYIQREIVARTKLINCGNHARTWDILRLTEMPTVELFLGYLSNPDDVKALTDPATRDAISEAIVVAIKRLYLLDQDDMATGTYRFEELLAAEQA